MRCPVCGKEKKQSSLSGFDCEYCGFKNAFVKEEYEQEIENFEENSKRQSLLSEAQTKKKLISQFVSTVDTESAKKKSRNEEKHDQTDFTNNKNSGSEYCSIYYGDAYRGLYLTTISGEGIGRSKYKKQYGGYGRYADVCLQIEPCNIESGLVFNVSTKAIPARYIPAVEKAVREAVSVISITGVKVTLCDGSYHPVDSTKDDFEIATGEAFLQALSKTTRVFLEAIGIVNIYVPSDHIGDILAGISTRRGRILSLNDTDNQSMSMSMVGAELPLAELDEFVDMAQSVTKGRGNISVRFSRYDKR